MKIMLTLLFAVSGTAAFADPGHFAGVAGHDHWIAGIALGVAIGLAVWGVRKGSDEADDIDEIDEEPQEA